MNEVGFDQCSATLMECTFTHVVGGNATATVVAYCTNLQFSIYNLQGGDIYSFGMKAIIKDIIDETRDIKSFRLKPERKLSHVAGQWMYVRLSTDLKHHFTISTSPTEEFLQFTTKFRTESEYKQALWQKKEGDEVEVNGPFGSFVLDEKDTTPRLFIAGGIGITPFRSMIKYATDRQLNLSITLLYSGKNIGEMAFLNELRITNNVLRIIETEKEGRLDQEKIKEYCPDWRTRTWWVCGPPAMVEGIVELGQKMGVAVDKLRSEEFTGY